MKRKTAFEAGVNELFLPPEEEEEEEDYHTAEGCPGVSCSRLLGFGTGAKWLHCSSLPSLSASFQPLHMSLSSRCLSTPLDQPLQCVEGSVLSPASLLSRLYTAVELKETTSIELFSKKKLGSTHVQISTKVNRRNARGSILVKPINISKSGLNLFMIIIACYLFYWR